MYSNLEYMLLLKYILILLNIIEFNSAYSAVPYVHFRNNHIKNTERKICIIRNKCGYINNITEYIFEICAIIDIMLPKK